MNSGFSIDRDTKMAVSLSPNSYWVNRLWEEAENRWVNRLTIEPQTFCGLKEIGIHGLSMHQMLDTIWKICR